jgi:outer membrane protein assembly factor BamE (lipoprotein component of BamABCDE complex)
MFRFSLNLIPTRIGGLAIFGGVLILLLLVPSTSRAQTSKGSDSGGGDNTPAYNSFRGVRIGMTADETRKKLGSPRDKGAEQDFYVFNDNEAVQIFYKDAAVIAISVDFMTGASSIPTSKDVLGAETPAKPDGSVYKMVRYPKAGYWVSYSRTAGNEPTTTITMQKIQ